jgi:hypothetical protein
MIIGEVVAGEGAILARRFVEHRDVGLYAVLVDQPAEHDPAKDASVGPVKVIGEDGKQEFSRITRSRGKRMLGRKIEPTGWSNTR